MPLKKTWANGEQFNASDMNELATVADAAYVKPGTGIPSSDLASAVQTSLGKADTAVQSVSSTNITDATTTGKALITTTDASTARTTLGVAYGTTAGTVCQGNDSRLSPTSNSLTDATTTGKALITATDAAAARTTLGVAYGTTSTTVAVGNDSRITGAEQSANKGAANGYCGLDSGTKVAIANLPTGTTSSTVCIGNDSRLSDARTPTAAGQVADLSIVAFGANTARAASSYGDFPFGVKLQRAITFSSVTFRVATADASGNLVVELRKNGSQVSGTSTTIAAANQVAGGTSTGTWAFASGDIITVYVTGVGTTPGKGLIADITGLTT